MAGNTYSLEPKEVAKVETKYRTIVTKIPAPESIPILETLHKYEPVSMTGQPLVVWDRAEGVNVYDRWGNKWLDWSSGVLVTSAGHGRQEIIDAVAGQARAGLLHNYCFPSEIRAKLVRKLVEMTPDGLDKAFLLTTGSETTECAIKLSKTHGLRKGGKAKQLFVTFANAFHGRTMGAQLAGGSADQKEWIGEADRSFVQAPFPGDWRTKDQSFDGFLQALAGKGASAERVCGVMFETYQGGNASFLPQEFAEKLWAWTREHDIVLTCDEVQAGFGRTGTMFGFEHYGLVPDLACFGKGIASSLPLSAILGRADLMDLFPPGSMTSTHTGNPVCCAAALANIAIIESENLAANSAAMGKRLKAGLDKMRSEHADRVGRVDCIGLVAAVHMVKPGTTEPDGDAAFDVVARCIERGLLFFSPVGMAGSVIKVSPPLCIAADAVDEGLEVLAASVADVVTAATA